ncbi:hypothetical protein [Streptomyces atratus]|uniref:hypothetical protein n=1 Tax=Streptomyces atratus TaxID=1893 RepID=UPI0033CCDE2C
MRLTALNTCDNTALSRPLPVRHVTVPPHDHRTVRFTVTPDDLARAGPYRLVAAVGHPAAGSAQAGGSALSTVPLRELAQAYDNIGITQNGNPQPGDIDGAQSSLAAEGLAAAGVRRGGTVTAGGFTFALPEPQQTDRDNAVADGQTSRWPAGRPAWACW